MNDKYLCASTRSGVLSTSDLNKEKEDEGGLW